MSSTFKWLLGIFNLIILISIIGGKEAIIAPLIIIIFALWLFIKYRSGH